MSDISVYRTPALSDGSRQLKTEDQDDGTVAQRKHANTDARKLTALRNWSSVFRPLLWTTREFKICVKTQD